MCICTSALPLLCYLSIYNIYINHAVFLFVFPTFFPFFSFFLFWSKNHSPSATERMRIDLDNDVESNDSQVNLMDDDDDDDNDDG